MISKFKTVIFNSYFLKSFILLTGSSILAQVINLIGYPIIARLYNPTEFGVLAAYTSIIGVCSSFTTGQYELAIPTVEKKVQAHQLVLLSFVVSVAFAILISIAIVIFRIFDFYEESIFLKNDLLWLLPVSIVLINGYTILSTYFVKTGEIKIIFKTKITQVIAKNFTQIVGGLYFAYKELFLILGVVLSQSTGLANFIKKYWSEFPKERSYNVLKISRHLYAYMVQFRNYPIYLIPSRLLNKGGLEMPVLFFSVYYGSTFTGYFSMANQLILLPFGIIMQSLSKSYINEFSNIYNNSQVAALEFYRNFNRRMLVYTLPACIALCCVVKPILLFFLGDKWQTASHMAPYFVIFGYFQLVYSTISQTLNVVNKQSVQLKWNFFRILAVLIAFTGCFLFSVDEFFSFRLYIFIMIIFYLILGKITISMLKSVIINNEKS